jgi:hypothetical protein
MSVAWLSSWLSLVSLLSSKPGIWQAAPKHRRRSQGWMTSPDAGAHAAKSCACASGRVHLRTPASATPREAADQQLTRRAPGLSLAPKRGHRSTTETAIASSTTSTSAPGTTPPACASTRLSWRRLAFRNLPSIREGRALRT